MSNRFELAIFNRLKSGQHIAAEVKATSDARKRWIGIFVPKYHSIEEDVPSHAFSILDFELDTSKQDEYFSDQDMINQKRYYVDSEDELVEKLHDLSIDLSTFTYPWKYDFPF